METGKEKFDMLSYTQEYGESNLRFFSVYCSPGCRGITMILCERRPGSLIIHHLLMRAIRHTRKAHGINAAVSGAIVRRYRRK